MLEQNINWLPPGIEPTTRAYNLTRNRRGNLLVEGMTPNWATQARAPVIFTLLNLMDISQFPSYLLGFLLPHWPILSSLLCFFLTLFLFTPSCPSTWSSVLRPFLQSHFPLITFSDFFYCLKLPNLNLKPAPLPWPPNSFIQVPIWYLHLDI